MPIIKSMKTITVYTVSELMKESGKSRNAVESWLSYNEIKPIIPEMLYPPDTLEKLLNAKVGRPAKKAASSSEPNPKPPEEAPENLNAL